MRRIPEELTKRERESLDIAATGKPYTEIAVAMGISADTVQNHLRAVRAKLRTYTTMESVYVWQKMQREEKLVKLRAEVGAELQGGDEGRYREIVDLLLLFIDDKELAGVVLQ